MGWGIVHDKEFEYKDYRCEVVVYGGENKKVAFDVVSGMINVGKWFRDSLYQLTGELTDRTDNERFFSGLPHTFEKDGLFYLWRCTPYVSTFTMPTVEEVM